MTASPSAEPTWSIPSILSIGVAATHWQRSASMARLGSSRLNTRNRPVAYLRWTSSTVYKTVAIGASGLAGELAQIEREFPPAEGHRLTLVRVFQATSELMIVEQEGQSEGVLALESARVSLELEGSLSTAHTQYDPTVITARVINVMQARGLR